MASFDDFTAALEDALKDFASAEFKDFRDAAIADGRQFFDEAEDKLKRWTQKLADGKIDAEEFEDLLLGQKDLARMKALKQRGLAKARLDKFVNGLLGVVMDTAVKTFLV